MCHFQAQNGTFVLKNFFLVQTIIITFIYLLALFIVQNLKKNSSSGSRVMRMRNFWAQTGPFLLMSLVSFINAYLHAKNQRQIFIY